MIDKTIHFEYGDNNSEVLQLVHSSNFTKTAEYSQVLVDFIKTLKEKEDRAYALVNALSAMEYYGCFFKDQKVITKNGSRNIQDLREGELVLTHNKRFRPILKTYSSEYVGNKVLLKIQNLPEPQESTDNHPYWVLSKEQIEPIRYLYYKQKINREEFLKELSKLIPEFTAAKNIKPGDYVYSIYKYDYSVPELEEQKAYLYGYYLSEGCLAKRYDKNRKKSNDFEKIIFVMNLEGDLPLIENLENIAANFNHPASLYETASSDKTCRIQINWKEESNILDKYFGHHSTQKYIHSDIFQQSREWKLKFIGAYLDGDGFVDKSDTKYKGTIKCSTASRTLALDLQRLLASVDVVSSVSLGCNKSENACFGNNDHKIYEISIGSSYTSELLQHTKRLQLLKDLDSSITYGGFYILPNGYMLLKIKSVLIEETEQTKYNLEVEEDNTYVVDIVGHNSNRNGDAFPEEALKEYHKTFEALGHVYRHHVNKDPEKSMGKVVFSNYNPEMHRVELIIELDKVKAEDVITKLDKGDLPSLSMGCRVPFDVCSYCGNKAKTRIDYCDHLKNHMNEVLPSGQKIVAINTMPKFFDISVVLIPADRTAGFLSKVAGYNGKEVIFTKSARLLTSPESGLQKVAEQDTYAEIRKNIEAKVDCVSSDPKLLIRNSQSRIPDEKLKKLAEFPFNQVLSTMSALRIFPLKEDFQKLALYNLGEISLADELEQKGEVFNISAETVPEVPVDVTFNNYNEKIAELLMEEISEMALTKELIITRALTKLAEERGTYFNPQEQVEAVTPSYLQQPPVERSFLSKLFFGHTTEPETTAHKNPLVPLGILGSLYYGYAKVFNSPSTTGFRQFMLKNKWLLPVLVGAGTVGSLFAQDEAFKKTAGVGVDRFFRNSLVSIPISYYISGVQENKAKKGEPITETGNFIRKHPVLTGLAASLALVKGENLLDKSFEVSKLGELVAKMDDAHLQLIYTDLIN